MLNERWRVDSRAWLQFRKNRDTETDKLANQSDNTNYYHSERFSELPGNLIVINLVVKNLNFFLCNIIKCIKFLK